MATTIVRSSRLVALLAVLVSSAGCGAPAEPDDDAGVTADGGASEDGDARVVEEEQPADDVENTTEDAPIEDSARADESADESALDAALDEPFARDASIVDARPDARPDALTADARADGPADARMDAGLDAPAMTGDRCPEGMVLVNGTVCVDRWEAAVEELGLDGGVSAWSPYNAVDGHRVRAFSRADVVPQGYISGSQAQGACREAGKRLCLRAEWMSACQGPMRLTYPYGMRLVAGNCNVGRRPHPLVQFYGRSDSSIYTYANMNNPGINMQADSLARTGQYEACVSAWGTYDMHGNLHEWVSEADGTFKGGFYADTDTNGAGCNYTTTAHAFAYHDYSTGFRCCADPR